MGLSTVRGKKLNEFVSAYTVFDFETTGTSIATDEVIEVAAVRVRDGVVVDSFSSLINPGRPIPEGASIVNGIYDDMVFDKPVMKDLIRELVDFLGDDVLVGHNIHTFDMPILYRDVDRFFGTSLNNNYVDSLSIAKLYYPEMRHRRLCDMADKFEISSEGAHRALADVEMNQKIYEAMKIDIEVNGRTLDNIEMCPKCQSPLVRRNGMYGPFFGCSSYPNCKFTRNIKE